MHRFVLLPLVFLLMAATPACQPTGHPRCDRIAFTARAVIEDHGYRVDCTPGFTNIDPKTGIPHSGWTDPSTMTVWIWADKIPVFVNRGSDDAVLLKTMWHEAAHTTGIKGGTCTGEVAADQYTYKHMRPSEREGIGFFESCSG